MATRLPRITIQKGRFRYHVRITGVNGGIIATTESYYSKSNAIRSAKHLAKATGLGYSR